MMVTAFDAPCKQWTNEKVVEVRMSNRKKKKNPRQCINRDHTCEMCIMAKMKSGNVQACLVKANIKRNNGKQESVKRKKTRWRKGMG